jgi:DNA-binding CsgD family transcriptional regulator
LTALTGRDAERVLRLVAEAESLSGDEPITPDLLVELGGLVAADWIGYSEVDWEGRRLMVDVEHPDAEEPPPGWDALEDVFWAEFADVHPIRRAALRGYVGALRISDFASKRVLRLSRFYNGWMRMTACEHIMDLSLRSVPNRTRTFHFDRVAGRDFTERDRAVLDALEPHLARLLEAASLRRQLAVALEELDRSRPSSSVEALDLTERELEVLTWVAQGKMNAEIAELLWLAPSTVRKHLENVYAKLGVSTRTAAVSRVFGYARSRAS